MENICNWLCIEKEESLFKPTFDRKAWLTTYYQFDTKLNYVNPEVISESWKKDLNKSERIWIEVVWYSFIKKYEYNCLSLEDMNFWKFWSHAIKITDEEKKLLVFS